MITIYTCITNGYDEIPDDHYYDPDIQYVCFTDGSIEKKGPWEFREIPITHQCPRRLSAYPKINPHKLFPVGTRTAWIDGCYTMTEKYTERCKEILDANPFTIMRHNERFSYMDECLEGFLGSMNTWDDVITITKTIKEVGYNFFKYCSPVLGGIWRVVSEDLFEFHDLWWKYSLIGPNRDQISFDTARQLTNMPLTILEKGWMGDDNWSPGTVGVQFGSQGKTGRRKTHTQAGHMDQYKEREDILKEIRKLTGMHPVFYATYDHTGFIRNNVTQPKYPSS